MEELEKERRKYAWNEINVFVYVYVTSKRDEKIE